ncbi:MAG: glutamine synthetase family protein [Phototrophicaceae bacterium]
MTRDQIFEQIDTHGLRFIELWFTDITGGVKSITIPVKQLPRILEQGAHFDGSALESFARVAESDMLLMPDLNTFTLLPWSDPIEKSARLICNVLTTEGTPFIGDPRAALIRVLDQAHEMGYSFKVGVELEFFLFDRYDTPTPPEPVLSNDSDSYFDAANDASQHIRRRLAGALDEMGIRVLSAHHEIGAGQHEIDLLYDHALAAADKILTARVALKAMARQQGLHCTFMPRPSAKLPGSGMHTHQTLHDRDTDRNVFYDESQEYGLSLVAQHFLAGQLAHARAMAAILAPLVNSYKRLGTSFEAPVHVAWAHIHRAAMIRIPGLRPGNEQHTRLELRMPDPSANPYLAVTVMLAAGLDGIQQKTALPPPLEEGIFQQNRARLRQLDVLPHSLRQALEVIEQDEVMLAALGPYITDRYLAAKRQEYEEYTQQVTEWEVQRYFNRY